MGQIILPVSSYDSSLDLSEMFPPLHFLPFLTLSHSSHILLLFNTSRTLRLSSSKPLKMWISVYSLCSDSIPLFYTATTCFIPNEVEHHTDRSARLDTKRQKWRKEEERCGEGNGREMRKKGRRKGGVRWNKRNSEEAKQIEGLTEILHSFANFPPDQLLQQYTSEMTDLDNMMIL